MLNAYLQPLFSELPHRARGAAARRRGTARPLVLMQSSGGVISAKGARHRPIRTLESGPAGGVIGAHALAELTGHRNVICADVGGTTYDVALIEEGQILEATSTEVGRRPIVGPIIDMTSIGAGGGSIAWIDTSGAVRVGPHSAGAHPGPACFGHGGSEPTVTDCQLLLGRLDPANFLGAAHDARRRRRGDRGLRADRASRRGISVSSAAAGILSIAESSMAYAIRTVTVERGVDPREFAIFSYGGGGGLFAAATAQELDIGTVLVPARARELLGAGDPGGRLPRGHRRDAGAAVRRRHHPGGAGRFSTLRAAVTAELRPWPRRIRRSRSCIAQICASRGRTSRSRSRRDAWIGDAAGLLEGCARGSWRCTDSSTATRASSAHWRSSTAGAAPPAAWRIRDGASGRDGTPAEPRIQPQGLFRARRATFIETQVFDRDSLGRGQPDRRASDRRGVDDHDDRSARYGVRGRSARQPRPEERVMGVTAFRRGHLQRRGHPQRAQLGRRGDGEGATAGGPQHAALRRSGLRRRADLGRRRPLGRGARESASSSAVCPTRPLRAAQPWGRTASPRATW